MRALVLEDQNYSAALSVVRALGALGHVAVVAAPWPTPAALSRWCAEGIIAPWASDRLRYADFALSLLSKGSYDIAFACTDTVIEIISRLRAELPARPDFLVPAQESLETARSKLAAQRFAARLGVPTPRTAEPHTLDELDSIARELGFPLVIKGDTGSGGTHVRYVADPNELRRAYQDIAESGSVGRPMVQEFIPGDVYLTHVLYNRGELVAICSHLKERHFPPSGGITARGVTVDEPELDAQVAKIFSALRWHGLAKADFKRDERDGRFKLMELDPRVSASIDIPRAAGVDMVGMCCQIAAAGRVEPKLEYAKGIRVRYVCRDALCLAAQPSLLPSFVLDTLNGRVRSDFDWRDMGATLGLVRRGIWAFEDAWERGQIAGERADEAPGRPRASRTGRRLHRILLEMADTGLRGAKSLFRAAKSTRRCVGNACSHLAIRPQGSVVRKG